MCDKAWRVAHHVTRCRFTEEVGVQSALDDRAWRIAHRVIGCHLSDDGGSKDIG